MALEGRIHWKKGDCKACLRRNKTKRRSALKTYRSKRKKRRRHRETSPISSCSRIIRWPWVAMHLPSWEAFHSRTLKRKWTYLNKPDSTLKPSTKDCKGRKLRISPLKTCSTSILSTSKKLPLPLSSRCLATNIACMRRRMALNLNFALRLFWAPKSLIAKLRHYQTSMKTLTKKNILLRRCLQQQCLHLHLEHRLLEF